MATELKHTVTPAGQGGDYNTLDEALDHLAASHANLVTADVYAVIEIGGTWSSADTRAVSLPALTTDATRFLYIYTTAAARHKGIWSTSAYMLNVSNATAIAQGGKCNNFWIDGLQIGKSSENANYLSCIAMDTYGVDAGWQRISNCVLRGDSNNTYRSRGISAELSGGIVQIWNCIAYGHGTINNASNTCLYVGAGTCSVYSSTFIGGHSGIYRAAGTITTKNCYARGAIAAYNGVGASFTMTNCSSSDATSEDTEPLDNVALDADTFVNVTYATADFHLAADGNSPLQGTGVDTSGSAAPFNFTTDIDGDARDATWDIGADGWVAAAGPELHSGAVTISGVGAVSSAASKGAKASVLVTGLGILLALGMTARAGAVTVPGVGAIAAYGEKGEVEEHSGSVIISGVGGITAHGSRASPGSVTVSGIGSVAPLGIKGGQSGPSVAGVGALAPTGTKGGLGSPVVAGVGALVSLGEKGAQGDTAITGVGTIEPYGLASEGEIHSGAVVISGNGMLDASGAKAAFGVVSISGVGRLSGIATKDISGAVMLSGCGHIGVFGNQYVYVKTSVDPRFWASKKKYLIADRMKKKSHKTPGAKLPAY